MSKAIGMVEYKTVSAGITAADAMVKTSEVSIIEAQTVCPGKYIAIITGDLTQKDLPFDSISGLEESLRVLRKVKEIGVCELTNKDVVRHPLVQKIVAAYDQYEAARSAKKNKNNNNKKNRRQECYEYYNRE